MLADNFDDVDIQIEVQEVLNIVGLNQERALNQPFNELNLITNDYLNGLLIYKREEQTRVTADVHFNNYRMISRFILKVSHPSLINLKKNGELIQNDNTENQSHLLIFEHSFKDVDEELVIGIKDINEIFDYAVYGKWRMVDIDGFLEGNSFNRETADIVLIE